ncbi:ATP-binding protein [Candidatus Bathyarchaeota archaeon]|nr:ATP-binding protein [Candidatus Bathyarchaeota archaeon]
MAEASLITQNPWWLNKNAINSDKNIQSTVNSAVKWIPRLLYTIDMDIDAVYTLRGPRQVGKTTLVKILIKKLIENNVEGRRVFYWSCDMEQGSKDLLNLINNYIDTTRTIYNERLYLFLDEISFVKDWQNTIKYLYDLGKLKNTTIILTGSHSIDIKNASEKLPGRRGTADVVYDKIFLPMKFSEFIEIKSPELNKLLMNFKLFDIQNRSSIVFNLAKGNIPNEINELNLYLNLINNLFNEYLITGGIINAISTYSLLRKLPKNLYDIYISSTIGDIKKWQKNELFLSQILKVIIDKMPNPLSWNSIKNETDVGSQSTVAEYVDILKASYVLCPIYKINRKQGMLDYKKGKKIHFLDPFIFHSLNAWIKQLDPFELCLNVLTDDVKKSNLIENIVCSHLIRYMYDLNPSDTFDISRNLFYWDNGNTEVDCVIKLSNEYLPIEVKYRNQIENNDYKGLFSFFEAQSIYKGTLLSKNTLKIHSEISTIPVPIYLLLL